MSYRALLLSGLACLSAGCASGPPPIDQLQPEAISMAVRRGQFEMNCPAATGQLISREEIQPLVNNFRFQGTLPAEYTVGVAGRGRRATCVGICPENGGGCF